MSIVIDQPAKVAVYLEVGTKRVFAAALDWPGWCRSGKDEPRALDALTASTTRYAVVAQVAGVSFPDTSAIAFDVVERLPGTATTDFGAPDRAATRDSELLTPDEAARLAAILVATWVVFDRVVADAPAELRKGPRGGGRDRNGVVEHVVGAETMYARKLGIRQPQPGAGDRTSVTALRAAIVAAVRAAADDSTATDTSWLPRYAVRRIAWHVLDHAWEIEDRSG